MLVFNITKKGLTEQFEHTGIHISKVFETVGAIVTAWAE